MPKRKRVTNCVVLNCLGRPGAIWRFFRRYYFFRLNRRIEKLPKLVGGMGRKDSV